MPYADPERQKEYMKNYCKVYKIQRKKYDADKYVKHKKDINQRCKDYHRNHRESILSRKRNNSIFVRLEIIELLGNKCSNPNCPIPSEKMDKRALQVDHVNGGGSKERKFHHSGSYYNWIFERIKNGSKDYQLLCAYCNWIKRYEKRELLHERDNRRNKRKSSL